MMGQSSWRAAPEFMRIYYNWMVNGNQGAFWMARDGLPACVLDLRRLLNS